MRRTLLVCVMAALWPLSARADSLTVSLEQPLYESAHTVDIRVADGVAIYKVRREFVNPGKRSDQAILEIDLPYGAAATGLRIKARDRWYDGELMEREQAAALYREMTGMGPYRPKDPALLSWAWADKLYLQVFPVMPGQVSTVEYTLTAPTRYANGRYWVSYPRVDATAAAPHTLATPVVTIAGTEIEIDGQRVAGGKPVMVLAPAHPPWMELIDGEQEAASYVASAIEVPASSHTTKPFDTATVALDIAHTYQSDLHVDLLTPQGKRIVVRDQDGGGANDLRGNVTVKLPPGTTGAGTWRFVVSDHAALDTGSLDGWRISFGAGPDATAIAAADVPIFIPDAPESASDAGVASICVGAPKIVTLAARLGRVVASADHAIARVELDAAPRVSELPKRAQVVFVLDRSRSIGAEGLTAQLALIRAYLAHVPDADVEVVAFDRHATRLFGELLPAPAALEKLAAAANTIVLGNGSALDEAARLAATVLAGRSGPRRVVMMSDELVRSALPAKDAIAALDRLPPDTVVHLVVPEVDHDDRAKLERDDTGALAPMATRHHGIRARVAGFPVRVDKDLARLALELVRPTRIEQLAVPGFSLESSTLREGEGLRLVKLGASAPARLVVTGRLWSDPVRQEVRATEPFSRAAAAFVFGEDRHDELSEAEQMRVALYARAVSPVTLYVAAEPGTRPSTDGLDDGNAYGGLLGNEAGEMNGGFGYGMRRRKPDLATLIDTAPCLTAHPQIGPWKVELTVETTQEEVVDVETATPGAFAACVVETVWALHLEATAFDQMRETFKLTLRAP